MSNEDVGRNADDAQNLGRNTQVQEGNDEVHYQETVDRRFPRGIKLELPRFAGKNPSACVYTTKFHQDKQFS